MTTATTFPMRREDILEQTGIDIHDFVHPADLINGMRMSEYLYQVILVGMRGNAIALHDTDILCNYEDLKPQLLKKLEQVLARNIQEFEIPLLRTGHQFEEEIDLIDYVSLDHPITVHYDNKWDGKPPSYSFDVLESRLKTKIQSKGVPAKQGSRVKAKDRYDQIVVTVAPVLDLTFASRSVAVAKVQRDKFKKLWGSLHKITGISIKGYDRGVLDCLDQNLRRRCFNPAHIKEPVQEFPRTVENLEDYLDCWREMVPDFLMKPKK